MRKIFYLIICVVCISCTTNTIINEKNSEPKVINNTTNYKEEASELNFTQKKEALINWNSKGYFNKYKYWFLFLIVYSIVGSKLLKKNDNVYDNRKIKTAYLYFIFSSLFGGHIIYIGKYKKYWIYSILLLIFLYINTFNIISYYNNPSIMIANVNEHLISKIILCIILIILSFDLFTLSIQVFKTNKSFRDNISPKVSKERESSFLEIQKSVEENNTLMLKEYNQWKN